MLVRDLKVFFGGGLCTFTPAGLWVLHPSLANNSVCSSVSDKASDGRACRQLVIGDAADVLLSD